MAGNDWWKPSVPFPIGQGSSGGSSGIGRSLATSMAKAVLGRVLDKREKPVVEHDHSRSDEILNNPPPVHGSARWALPAELDDIGLLRPPEALDNPRSILLGVLAQGNGPMLGQLHWDGEGHLISVAPTRSGKSTTQIVPNLLRYRGSCVVLDPKGELFRDTAAWRAANVGPVYRISPFDDETHGFNPLATVKSFSDARGLADLIMPTDTKAQDFFKKDAVAFLTGLILFVLERAPPHRRSMAEVRRITALETGSLLEVVREMAKSKNSSIANPASVVLGKPIDRGLSSLRETLNTELSLWDDPGIAAATSSSDVDFHALKDRPATVYITVPFHLMSAYASFLKVLLTCALDAMVQNPRIPDIPVLFVLDEFLALGPSPKFREAIRTHAGAGVRLWFFLQDVSTLTEHYPQAWQAFFNASVKCFFGTDEPFTGKLVTEQIGQATVAYLNMSVNRSRSVNRTPFGLPTSTESESVNESVVLTGRPLLTPTEVVSVLSGTYPDSTREGIILVRGAMPVRARMVPWFKGAKLKARVTPSLQPPTR